MTYQMPEFEIMPPQSPPPARWTETDEGLGFLFQSLAMVICVAAVIAAIPFGIWVWTTLIP
jgi:hypothetical protein